MYFDMEAWTILPYSSFKSKDNVQQVLNQIVLQWTKCNHYFVGHIIVFTGIDR